MSPEGTDFLYPFIDAGERDAGALLADLAASAEAKATESRRLRVGDARAVRRRPRHGRRGAWPARFAAGGRLFTFGNGGSATDAAGLAAAVRRAARRARPCRPGRSRPTTAVLTALGNDVGFDLVFARQLIAHGAAG